MDNTQLPIDIIHWTIAMLPIAALMFFLVGLRWKGIEAGPLGMLAAGLVALLVFRTPLSTLAVAGGKGLWDAVFILYVVWSALLLYLVTVRAGAFDALRRGFLSFSRNELFLVLAIGWAFASFFQGVAGFGAPIAVTAPLLIGIGVRPVYAVVIPLIAHAWAKMFGTLAVGWLVMFNVVEIQSPLQTAIETAILLWLVNLLGGLAVAWFYGRMAGVRHGLPMILIISAIHGGVQLAVMYVDPILSAFVAGTVALVALYPLSHWKRYSEPASGIKERPAMMDREEQTEAESQADQQGEGSRNMGLGLALFPYILLTITTLLGLAVPPVNAWLSQFEIGLPFPAVETGYGLVREAAAPYSSFAPLTHPGTFVLLSALVSLLVYRWKGYGKTDPDNQESLWRNLVKDSVPSSISIASFLVMSKLMDHSGQTTVLAQGLAVVSTTTTFAFASNWIGILGAFMTSSSTASNILFSALQGQAAEELGGLSQSSVLAAQGTGGAIGNVIAPANIVLGSTTAGIVGQEGEILRVVLPWTVITGVLVGIATIILNLF